MTLRVATWTPSGPDPKGTVCLLQGRAEFIEKYFEVVAELLDRGFAVVAFDWRGQGHSGRRVRNPRKGHVRSFREYRTDLEAIRDEVLRPRMPQPFFALAHSMGGAVAIRAVHDGWSPFRRIVTTTPMVQIAMIRRVRLAVVSARLLRLLGLGKAFIPAGGETSIATKPFSDNPLTSDPARYARNAAAAAAVGSGAIGDPTIGWIDAAFRFMKGFMDPRFGLKVRSPVLILAAGADLICATPAAERFAARLKAGFAIVLPGARHEILMERDRIREQFWAAFDAFVPGTPDSASESTGPVELASSSEVRAAALMSTMLSTARKPLEQLRTPVVVVSETPEVSAPELPTTNANRVAPAVEPAQDGAEVPSVGAGMLRAEPALPRVSDAFTFQTAKPAGAMAVPLAPAVPEEHSRSKDLPVEPVAASQEAPSPPAMVEPVAEPAQMTATVTEPEAAELATPQDKRLPLAAGLNVDPADTSQSVPTEDSVRPPTPRLPAATMLPLLGGRPSALEELEGGGVDTLVPGGDDPTSIRR
jgi:lysophospholipase